MTGDRGVQSTVAVLSVSLDQFGWTWFLTEGTSLLLYRSGEQYALPELLLKARRGRRRLQGKPEERNCTFQELVL